MMGLVGFYINVICLRLYKKNFVFLCNACNYIFLFFCLKLIVYIIELEKKL